jgi:spoIIIJ-associated protein
MFMNDRIAMGRRVSVFLRSLIVDSGLELTARVEVHAESPSEAVSVYLEGRDVPALMANRGELLDAVEQLSRDILRLPPGEEELVCFEAGGFREARDRRIRSTAKLAMMVVANSGVAHEFAPMPETERMLLTRVLTESGGQASSTGAGARRHVVLYPAGAGEVPQKSGMGSRLLA